MMMMMRKKPKQILRNKKKLERRGKIRRALWLFLLFCLFIYYYNKAKRKEVEEVERDQVALAKIFSRGGNQKITLKSGRRGMQSARFFYFIYLLHVERSRARTILHPPPLLEIIYLLLLLDRQSSALRRACSLESFYYITK